jgi:hypothetical protein
MRGIVGWGFPEGFVVIRCFVLCFSSLVVCLVLYRGCDYLLLDINVFCYCFCSLCSNLCAAAWVAVLVCSQCNVFQYVRWEKFQTYFSNLPFCMRKALVVS